jgi:outer membrane receptor protein involved in Fe transport
MPARPTILRRRRPVRRFGPAGWVVGVVLVAAGLPAALGGAEGAPVLRELAAMSLEQLSALKVDVVYGASRHQQETTAAPAAVTVVKRDDIRAHGHRTLADILKGVAGLYVTNDRGYSYLGVRGFNRPGDFGSRILVLLDGQRVNDGIYDAAATDTDFPIDADLIERVEIIRGPGSSLYGTNAFFGVINVVTRRGGDLEGTEATVSAGSYDAWSGRATYGRRFAGGLELLVSGSWQQSAGRPRLDFPEYTAVDLDGGASRSAFARIGWRDFTLQAGYARREKDWPTAAYGTVPGARDPRLSSRDTQWFANLRFERELPAGWLADARLYFDRYRYDGVYPYDYDADPATAPDVNLDFARAVSAGLDWSLANEFRGGHRLTLGGEWRHEFELRQRNWDEATQYDYVLSDRTGDVAGLFVQDEWAFSRRWLLNLGLRFDHYRGIGGTLNPRVAWIHRPDARSAVKVIYGEAFRAPSAYEAYYRGANAAGAPPLGPETTRSYEVVWERGFGAAWRGRASVFLSQVRDLIDFRLEAVPGRESDWMADTYVFENRGGAQIRGVEIEIERRLPGGVQGSASYTLAEARYDATRVRLDNSPRHLGKLNLRAPVGRGLETGLEIQAMSARRTPRGRMVGGTVLANLTLLHRTLAPGLELSATVGNLFDRRYADPVAVDFTYTGPLSGEFIPLDAVEQDGRTFRLQLIRRF